MPMKKASLVRGFFLTRVTRIGFREPRMQQLIADTLDDLLVKVFPKILRNGQRVKASKGRNKELSGVILELRNPLARLSRTETKGTLFSCLGETLWYLARSNELEFIKYYISIYGRFAESDGTIHGAYGPRLFGMRTGVNQIDNIIKMLRRKPNSRQAVVQLFNAEDLWKDYNDIPCTCTMQFFVRKRSLHLVVHMRSNDAFLGLTARNDEMPVIWQVECDTIRAFLGFDERQFIERIDGSKVGKSAPECVRNFRSQLPLCDSLALADIANSLRFKGQLQRHPLPRG
jgi:Thymidylate synthase